MTEPNASLRKAVGLARARSYGFCEGCGTATRNLDPHHRRARGAGGVHGAAEAVANSVVNLLMLCRTCHDETEHAETWAETYGMGWRLKQGEDPAEVPALIYTVNGYAWWLLNTEGGYKWVDLRCEHRRPT